MDRATRPVYSDVSFPFYSAPEHSNICYISYFHMCYHCGTSQCGANCFTILFAFTPICHVKSVQLFFELLILIHQITYQMLQPLQFLPHVHIYILSYRSYYYYQSIQENASIRERHLPGKDLSNREVCLIEQRCSNRNEIIIIICWGRDRTCDQCINSAPLYL